MDIMAFIDRSDFFQGVSPKSKELLADICIPKNLSKKDMAAAIGTTPETYSRLMARLLKEGKIGISGKNLTLHMKT
jgi:CRP-like cAMP-binding protein